jgi:hypothetical protein
VKKELLLYLFIVLLTALIFHPDLFTDPRSRLEMMSDRENYYHPLLFGLVIYLSIALLRLIVVGLKKIMQKHPGRARKH